MTDIPGFEGRYAITEDGRVWSYKVKRFMKQRIGKDGYCYIFLGSDTVKGKIYRIHRLVAATYLPNPDNLPEVNHRDEIKTNNCVTNLEWCSHQYNSQYSKYKQCKPVYCVELDTVFESLTAAKRATKAEGIGACCKGRCKTSGGYHWKYYTPETTENCRD